MKKLYFSTVLVAIVMLFGLSSCDSDTFPWGPGDLDSRGVGSNGDNGNGGSGGIDSLPVEDLSAAEINAIQYMIEEEKLARDVYITLYQKWNLRIFDNISKAEQTHYNALLSLIEKYDLDNPAEGLDVGEFHNEDLQAAFDALTAQGSKSEVDALLTGAEIEDLDIADLLKYKEVVDNEDILLVFDNLTKGSENHLRAFYSNLKNYSVEYTPKHISQELFDEIISGSQGGYGHGRRGR